MLQAVQQLITKTILIIHELVFISNKLTQNENYNN